MNSSVILERKNDHVLSLCNPDYVLEKNINLFLTHFTTTVYDTILDFGAGNSPYQSLFTCKQYVKVDVSQNNHNSIDIILNSSIFEPLPIDDSSVDVVLCMDVLEHSGHVEDILKDFQRVLKPGGIVLISVPFLYREHEMPYDLMRYTSSHILKEMINAQFKDVEVTKIGNVYFTLYSLWNESHIKFGEQIRISFFGRLLRKIFTKGLLPFFNMFVFDKSISSADSVYHHILINGRK